MVIEVHVVMNYAHTTVHNAITMMMQIRVLRAMMAITPALLKTANQSVYTDVKHARQVPRVQHVRRDIITTMVKKIVVIVTVLKIVFAMMVSVHHVRTDITIPVMNVIVYVQVTVSRVRRILSVDLVKMGIIKVTRTTTITSLF
jgi:hypothetical protein